LLVLNFAEPMSKFTGIILPTLDATTPGAGVLFSGFAVTVTPDNTIAAVTDVTVAIIAFFFFTIFTSFQLEIPSFTLFLK
jgi:hypothetical protein